MNIDNYTSIIACEDDKITVTFDRKPNTPDQFWLRSQGLCRRNNTGSKVWYFQWSVYRWQRIHALFGKPVEAVQ